MVLMLESCYGVIGIENMIGCCRDRNRVLW